MIKKISMAAIIVATLGTTGCSSLLTQGEQDFSCEAETGSTKCGVSTRHLFEVAEESGDFRQSLKDKGMLVEGDDSGESEDESSAKQSKDKEVQRLKNQIELLNQKLLSQKTTPLIESATTSFVRKSPEVIRIWIAPWVDSSDILNTGGFRYAEVTSKHWSIGNEIGVPSKTSRVRPHQIVKPKAKAPTAEKDDARNLKDILKGARKGLEKNFVDKTK